MTDRADAADMWRDGWRTRHRDTLLANGFTSVASLLALHPAEPYHKLVRRLSLPIAPIQLLQLQFDEAAAQGTFREAAMDLLVRTVNEDLKRGWQTGGHWKSNRAAAAAHFIVTLAGFSEEKKRRAECVWQSLVKSNPPVDWIPRDANDGFIRSAFDESWPAEG